MPVAAQDFNKGLEAYYDGNREAAMKEWKPLAEQGHAAAQYYLGLLYYFGWGVTKNVSEAIKWWRKAAEQGYAQAQYTVGTEYYEGGNLPKDYVKAAKWFSMAAKQRSYENSYMPQYKLGLMYDKGQGVPQDDVQAHLWYSLSAAQVNNAAVTEGDYYRYIERAEKNLKIVTERMTPTQIAEAQRLARALNAE
jgi:TPR repeat protein